MLTWTALYLAYVLHAPPAEPALRESAEPQLAIEARTSKPLHEAVLDAEFAITERNLRIVNHLHVGSSIRERGHADFPDYEVLLFCNLGYTRRMLEGNPAAILACPGRVAIREEKTGVVVSALLFPEKGDDPAAQYSIRRLNEMLREIVRYAAFH